ncbi:MAG: Smr/MutS family protein [Spirochaetes bacterium]|nr:Smr/MutS family protein [Spirochaetota bacterium]
MDFGDILKEWDDVRRRGGRTNAGSADSTKTSSKKANPASTQAGQKAGKTPDDAKPTASAGSTPAAASTKSAISAASKVQAAQQRWMDQHGIEDKDGHLAAFRAETLHRYLSRCEIDALPYDAVLDLHGMTALAAEEALETFFFEACSKKLRKVLIIHGKGIHSKSGPVLSEIVRRWLERHPTAGRSGTAGNEDGGSGATWVLLKNVR